MNARRERGLPAAGLPPNETARSPAVYARQKPRHPQGRRYFFRRCPVKRGRCGGVLAEGASRRYGPLMNYQQLITVEPGKRSGKPCIRGLRITVYDVLEYLAAGMTEDEILADFSELTREDIKACLAFAADRERKLFPPAA